ncbi:MAG: autotransporter outer membrane beta-barrel domain-containing protein, partial [Arenimonas sp.]
RKTSLNEAAFDARTGSVTAGIDWQLGKNWQVGGALNHVRENLDYSNSESEARTRFSGLLVTASRALGNTWSASSYYGRYRGNYQLSRDISFSLPLPSGPLNFSAEADASPNARRRVSGIAGNGQWSRRGWDLGLGLGMDKNETTIAAYEETGGNGFDLRVPGRRIGTRRGRVDFTLSRTFSNPHGVFQPSLRLGWRHEFSNVRRAVSVQLAEDPQHNRITFDTEDPDRNWGELAIGGVMTFTHGHSGFFELRQRVAHSFLQERMLAIGWRIEM